MVEGGRGEEELLSGAEEHARRERERLDNARRVNVLPLFASRPLVLAAHFAPVTWSNNANR